MTKKPLSFILGCISIVQFSFAQDDVIAPKYSNEFLNIGVDASALGMSNAVVASTNDVNSGYWNPAGLVHIEDSEIAIMHSSYFANIANYNYIAFAMPLDDRSSVGLSLIRFGVDDILDTTKLIDQQGVINYDRINLFSAADYALIFSYAKKLPITGLNYGVNAKVIRRIIGDFASSWGFGLDVGAQYKRGNWQFGATGRDITSTFNSWSFDLNERTIEVFESTGNEIPQNGLEITLPKLSLGAARSFNIKDRVGILVELNTDITTDGRRNVLVSGDPFSVDPNLGIEIDYMGIFFLRGGFGNVQRIKAEIGNYNEYTFQPNIGIGIRLRKIFIDYALSDVGNSSDVLYSNVSSLKFSL